MARLRQADSGIIFASCIYNVDAFSLDRLKELWNSRYCLGGFEEPSFNPSLSYYSKEMGENIKRVLLWADGAYPRGELVEGKLWADSFEQETSVEGARVVNIDIGIILKEQMLLSTSKPYSHRIFLRDGVWAELNYIFENKTYRSLPWTYPDYQCEQKVALFNSLRQSLLRG